jgi:hypothetical protein
LIKLIVCLDFYMDRYAEPDEFKGRFGRLAVSMLKQVKPDLVANEINTFGPVLQHHGDYIELLAGLIRHQTAWDSHHERLTRALADLPGQAVRPKLQTLGTLAHAQEVRARNNEALFIELFTRVALGRPPSGLVWPGSQRSPGHLE